MPAWFPETDDAGCLSLRGESVQFEHPDGTRWQVDVADILAVGEYTDPGAGFAGEDYFLILVDSFDSGFVAPIYADGVHETLSALESRIGGSLTLALTSTISFASRVMWPPELLGRPLFTWRKVYITSGRWWDVRRYARILWPMVEYEFAPDVVPFLRARHEEKNIGNLGQPPIP